MRKALLSLSFWYLGLLVRSEFFSIRGTPEKLSHLFVTIFGHICGDR